MSGCYLSGPLHSSLQKLQSLSIIRLDYNDLSAPVPAYLFSLPLLQTLELANNRFSGQIHEFSNVSSFQLNTLDLSNNYLEGPTPMSLFELRALQDLVLYSNNFSGSLHPNAIQQLGNVSYLDLSNSNLLIECNGANSSLSSLPQLELLYLTSIKLKTFPDFLRNLTNLIELDLSNNQIHGEIPNWMWKLTNLDYLNISYNNVEGTFPNLSSLHILDLRSNQFHGQLPTFLQPFGYLDLSRNNFSSVIPASSFINIYSLSLSSNKFHGHIPESICNATSLKFLDLSNNSLSGTIPQCLFAMSSIGVLKLKKNNLIGKISDTFPAYCPLVALNLNGNLLEGVVPKSLANCTYLEILDIGNNQIQDAFPCYLKYISTLRILILRSNKFYGSIGCGGPNATWLLLQIVDLASNNFSGKLSIKSFANSKAMVVDNKAQSEFNYLQYQNSPIQTRNYLNQRETSFLNLYLDAVTVSNKGLYFELRKIRYRFTSVDLSCNNFNRPIPEDIEVLKSLYILNLSHNAFTDRIPPSLGKLSELESLDLSSNKLTGEIPMQLADGLIFLSVLNLSFNQLIGPIPYIKQFATFSEASYEGNKGLYGCPLKKECTSTEPRSPPPIFEDSHSKSGRLIDWNYIGAELGFVFGFGRLVIGPLMFWKKWRIQYYKHVDDTFFKIFPQLYLWGEKYRRIRANRNGVHRH
jgi:Leucine-rich repeat (LRR) protein